MAIWACALGRTDAICGRIDEVTRARQFVSVLLLAVVCGYPAMACLTSAAAMTEAERECCKQMAQKCGGAMNMPASHSCCRAEIQQPDSMLHVATTQIAPPVAMQAATIDLPAYSLPRAKFSFFELHPSPESPPGSTSILRI